MSPLQFTLPIAELKPALAGLGKVIAKRCTLPVLGTIKIERTKDGWVALTGTDLDHHVTVRLEQPAAGEPGSLLVPYDELLKTCKACGGGEEILVEHGEGTTAAIKYRIGQQIVETRVESLPVAEFPEIPRIKGDGIPLPDTLRRSIHEALECASTDETRLILNGAYLDVSKPEANYVVATDGRHLFSSNSFTLPLPKSLLIPTHRFLNWKPFSADGEWQLKMGIPAQKDDGVPFQISSRRWRYLSREIAGDYPNWRQVVPGPDTAMTTMDIEPAIAEEIIETLARLPEHDTINHTLGLENIGKEVALLCRSSRDEPWTKVPVAGMTALGNPARIFLNRLLFAKALRFGLHRVEIIDALSPLRFSDAGRQIIIQPIRPEAAPRPTPTAPPASPAPAATNTNPPPTPAEQPKTTMPENTNGHTTGGAQRSASTTEKSALDTALAQIEVVRGDFRNAIADLNKLADALKAAQRESKASDKEISSVRQTLRSLQSVRI